MGGLVCLEIKQKKQKQDVSEKKGEGEEDAMGQPPSYKASHKMGRKERYVEWRNVKAQMQKVDGISN